MRELPIPFSGPMVRAILAGQKWQTRRVVKRQPEQQTHGWAWWHPRLNAGHAHTDYDSLLRLMVPLCPYGVPGDMLWMREAYRFPASLDRLSPSAVGEKALDAGYPKPWCPTQYEADGYRRTFHEWKGFTSPGPTEPGKLRPPMFLPRWACRLLLENKGVRVERLKSITREDALAEGIVELHGGGYGLPDGSHFHLTDPRQSYFSLWEAINGPGSVEANPHVWVVEFPKYGVAA